MTYFNINEFYNSLIAKTKGVNNMPLEQEKKVIDSNIIKLVDNILDPARKELGMPIIVTSGYRSEKVNSLIGGVPNSQHRLGEAADIVVPGSDNMLKLFNILKKQNKFDQLIWEKGGRWIHVSYTTRRRNRNQIIYT